MDIYLYQSPTHEIPQKREINKKTNKHIPEASLFKLTFSKQGYLIAGLNGGFLTFLLAVFMLPAWMSFRLSAKSFGHISLRYFNVNYSLETCFFLFPVVIHPI